MNLSLTVQLSQILTTLRRTGGIPARVHPEEYDRRQSERLGTGWRGPYESIFPNWAVIGNS
jgi:hypothetical protein